jgi:hypothetical protein
MESAKSTVPAHRAIFVVFITVIYRRFGKASKAGGAGVSDSKFKRYWARFSGFLIFFSKNAFS